MCIQYKKKPTKLLQKRTPLFILIVIILALIVFVSRSVLKTGKNTILIVIDTVRADKLGCYGNSSGMTPNIDDFAAKSVIFENAFSQASWTLPSMASVLTSKYPQRHGAGGYLGAFQILSEDNVSVAEVYQGKGYATAAVVNVFFLSEKFGLVQGFETVDIHLPESNVDTRRAEQTTNAALKWIDENQGKPFFLLVHYFDPFFLLVHYFDPHLVYDPPQPFREKFADPQDAHTTDYLFGTIRDMIELRKNQTAPSLRITKRLEKLHNGEIAYADFHIGRLFKEIEFRGLDKNTVFIITSDHGEEFLEHGGFEHGHTLYDELLHVPLIVYDPDVCGEEANSLGKVNTTVRLIDIAPTICELAGIESDPSFTGRSLVPLMKGVIESDRLVISQGNMWGAFGAKAFRKDNLKIIRQSSDPQIQLFDVIKDPEEKQNLAEKMPEQVKMITADLELIMKAVLPQVERRLSPKLSDEEIKRLRSLGYIK
jgi:arylsulfatase A-like enzyme